MLLIGNKKLGITVTRNDILSHKNNKTKFVKIKFIES